MQTILKAWRYSCSLFFPATLYSILKQSLGIFCRTSWQFLTSFGWLLVIDALLFLTFGDLIAKATQAQASSGKVLGSGAILLMLAQSLVWFLITSAFLLLLRKDDRSDPKAYFKTYFFFYIQILFVFSLIAFIGLYLLIMAKITKLPSLPWIVSTLFKTVEYCIFFYWLDAPRGLRSMFHGFERSINLIFYNAPFIIFLIVSLWGCDWGIKALVNTVITQTPSHLFFCNAPTQLLQHVVPLRDLIKILAVRYLIFALEYYWVSILFSFYRRKKHEQYTENIFEKV
jgi:hypothetical protein